MAKSGKTGVIVAGVGFLISLILLKNATTPKEKKSIVVPDQQKLPPQKKIQSLQKPLTGPKQQSKFDVEKAVSLVKKGASIFRSVFGKRRRKSSPFNIQFDNPLSTNRGIIAGPFDNQSFFDPQTNTIVIRNDQDFAALQKILKLKKTS